MAGAAHGAEVEDDTPCFLGEEMGRVGMGGAKDVEGHWKVSSPDVTLFLQAVAVVTAAFTKEALRKGMEPLDAIPGRSSEARAGMTGGVER